MAERETGYTSPLLSLPDTHSKSRWACKRLMDSNPTLSATLERESSQGHASRRPALTLKGLGKKGVKAPTCFPEAENDSVLTRREGMDLDLVLGAQKGDPASWSGA